MRYEFTTAPGSCPVCGSTHIAKILYGTPRFVTQDKYILDEENEIHLEPELEAQIKSGEIVLGGCFVFRDSPAWKCNNCKTKFYKTLKDNLQNAT